MLWIVEFWTLIDGYMVYKRIIEPEEYPSCCKTITYPYGVGQPLISLEIC